MAMNKKEKYAMEELRIVAALRWTSEILPDVMPPKSSWETNDLTKGYLHNSYSARVEKACSSSVYHASGTDERTTSQGSRILYSTKLLALRSMRYEVELRVAKELRSIDALIEKEQENNHD